MQLYVGASGDDKYGVAFSSGWMIQEINRFSVLSLYDNSKMDVSALPLRLTACLASLLPHACMCCAVMMFAFAASMKHACHQLSSC